MVPTVSRLLAQAGTICFTERINTKRGEVSRLTNWDSGGGEVLDQKTWVFSMYSMYFTTQNMFCEGVLHVVNAFMGSISRHIYFTVNAHTRETFTDKNTNRRRYFFVKPSDLHSQSLNKF